MLLLCDVNICTRWYTLTYNQQELVSASRWNEVWRVIFTVYGQFFQLPSHHWHWWLTHVHLTRGSAIVQQFEWHSVLVEVLSYCCTNDANRPHWWAFSATNTFYSTISIVLYTHFCNRSTNTQRACDDTHHLPVMLIWAIYVTPVLPWQVTTNIVDVKWAIIVVNKHRPPPMLLMTLHIPRLKPTCFTNPPPPVDSLLSSGLPSQTINRTFSLELQGFCF